MSLFSKYLSKVKRRLVTRLKAGQPILLHIPPSIDQARFLEYMGFKVIDISYYLARYPSRYLDRIKSRIRVMINRGYEAVSNLEYLYYLYPREREVYNGILTGLEGPVIITYANKMLFDTAVKQTGYEGLSISEASIDDLSEYLYKDDVLMSEGSPTFNEYLESYIDHVMRHLLMIRDSNERFLLYYFTRFRGVGRLARVIGPELGTYLKRLSRKGLIVKAGERRGVYMVRDPLIRFYVQRVYMPNEDPFKYVGYMYLFRKFLEGIKGRVSIPTATGDLYIAESDRFYFVDKRTFVVIDTDRVRYVFRLTSGEKEDVKIFDKFYGMEKVAVTPSHISSRVVKSLEKLGIKVLRVRDVNSFSRYTNFPRLI